MSNSKLALGPFVFLFSFSLSSLAFIPWSWKVAGAKAMCKTQGCDDNARAKDSIPSKKIALTFDDGPNSNTGKVLEVLKNHGIKATFFVLGKNVENNRTMIRKIVDEGHIVASHSWNHPNFWKLTANEIRAQILNTENALLKAGVRPTYFRYPHGNSTATANEILASRGYKVVGWHVDTCDWGFNKEGILSSQNNQICTGSSNVVSDSLSYLTNKARRAGIVLMHDTQSITARNLDQMLLILQQEGYQFVNIDNAEIFPLLNH